MKKIDLVVMGQNYSTSLGLIQAAGEVGYNVGVVHYSINIPKNPTPEMVSKYVGKAIAVKRDDPDLMGKIVDAFCCGTGKVVLLPADDYSVEFIDQHLTELEQNFYVPNIEHKKGKMFQCMDKKIQSRLSENTGIPTARCWSVLLDGSNSFSIPEDIIFPCITKPQHSIGSPKTFICSCNNWDELSDVLRHIDNLKPCQVLIEELINVETEYTVPGLALNNEVFIPALLQKTKIGSGAHKGVTVTGKVLNAKQFPELVDKLKRLVFLTGLEGVFDVELLKSGADFFFNELNLRNGAAGYALTRAGINLPELWIKYCRGEKIQLNDFYLKDGLSFVSDKAALDNFKSGYMSWHEYRKVVSSADFRFLIDNPDLSARRAFKRIAYKAIASRLFKQ